MFPDPGFDFIRNDLRLLMTFPVEIVQFFILACIISFGFATLLYRSQLNTSKLNQDYWKDRANHNSKLIDGKSPEELKAEIVELKRQISEQNSELVIASQDIRADALVNVFCSDSGIFMVRYADQKLCHATTGFTKEPVAIGNLVRVYTSGTVICGGLNKSDMCFLGIEGHITQAVPEGSKILSQVIGTAVSSQKVLFSPGFTCLLA